jgi:hypothetical protein
MIGLSHHIFIMLDDNDGIAQIDQFSEVVYQETTISWMQADGWLIENIGNSL